MKAVIDKVNLQVGQYLAHSEHSEHQMQPSHEQNECNFSVFGEGMMDRIVS